MKQTERVSRRPGPAPPARHRSGDDAPADVALVGGLETSTAFVLHQVGLRAREVVNQALEFLGLRVRHYVVLTLLHSAGPLPQQQVSRLLQIDRTTMVAVADDLERLGLAHRRLDPADRRAYRLTLTQDGAAALERARLAVDEAERRVLLPLAPEERALLHQLLLRLALADPHSQAAPGEATGLG